MPLTGRFWVFRVPSPEGEVTSRKRAADPELVADGPAATAVEVGCNVGVGSEGAICGEAAPFEVVACGEGALCEDGRDDGGAAAWEPQPVSIAIKAMEQSANS